MELLAYLRRQWKLLLLLAGIAAVFAAVFSLYDLPVEAVGYAALLCLVLGAVLFILGFRRFRARHRELRRLLDRAEEPVLPLPPADGLLEEDYQALLAAVAAHRTRILARERDKLEDMTCVCSVGLDMIAVPGSTTAETISAIIADEAAVGMVNSKTTAVRIIPVEGKTVGDVVEMGGLLGSAPLMPVHTESSADFIARGGRIPAPLQSLKN